MQRRESGYALLIVVLMAALLLVALSAAVPRLLTQGQREKEEEMIFRGEQYRQAIGRFYRKFGRFPNSIDELLHTNDRGFLRREFPDPMTPDGKWRLIRVGPSGELIGAVTHSLPLGIPAQKPSEGSDGDEDVEESDEAASGATGLPESLPGTASGSEEEGSRLPLAGIASRSRARAIKVFQGYDHYYQWEFIYDPAQEAVGALPGTPAQTPGSLQPGVPINRQTPLPRVPGTPR